MSANFAQMFEEVIPELERLIFEELQRFDIPVDKKTRWLELEAEVVRILKGVLRNPPFNILEENLQEPTGKSGYPDLKIIYPDKLFAIDIKTGEGTRSAYDIGRLDTYEESRINIYEQEYSVAVWCEGKNPTIVKGVFIEETYNLIGLTRDKTLSMRLYDGKLRPKSWADSQNKTVIWKSKEVFLEALEQTRFQRWIRFIAAWYSRMNRSERLLVRNALDMIDKQKNQKPIPLPEEEEIEDNGNVE